jgi:hypothetical protein
MGVEAIEHTGESFEASLARSTSSTLTLFIYALWSRSNEQVISIIHKFSFMCIYTNAIPLPLQNVQSSLLPPLSHHLSSPIYHPSTLSSGGVAIALLGAAVSYANSGQGTSVNCVCARVVLDGTTSLECGTGIDECISVNAKWTITGR